MKTGMAGPGAEGDGAALFVRRLVSRLVWPYALLLHMLAGSAEKRTAKRMRIGRVKAMIKVGAVGRCSWGKAL